MLYIINMLVCPKCSVFETKTLKGLVQHIGIHHANKPNFHLICGINGCPHTSKVFSSFRSHVYRKHRDILYDNVDGETDIALFCPECELQIHGLAGVTGHLRTHIESGEVVTCPYKDCTSTYNVYSSLTSHFSRNHPHSSTNDIKGDWFPNVEQDDEHQEQEVDVNVSANEDSVNEDVLYGNFEEDFLKSYSHFMLKLQEKYTLPESTVQSILHDVSGLFEIKGSYERYQFNNILKQYDIAEEAANDIRNIFETDVLQNAKEKLSSDYKRQKYYAENFVHVAPETQQLGRNGKGENCSYQYVPVLGTLKALLNSDDVLSHVCNPPESLPGILRHFGDGTHFKENQLFGADPNALQLFLYYDEFEVVNPLGAHKNKHKLAGFYYVLGNIYSDERSALYVIQLAVLCKVQDLVRFGLDRILQPLLIDLETLESEGIEVASANRTFRGTIASISGDNLGSHFLGGFTESFSGGPNSRLCRFCTVTQSDLQTCIDASQFVMRTSENYARHARLVTSYEDMSKIYGIKRDSPLNKLQHFHVTSGLPPDIMHDILEGVLSYELALIIPKMISDGHFTYADLNYQIRTWKYGPLDSRNKPVEIPENLASKSKLTMNAGRMWCFIRLLPLMIYDKLPSDNQYLCLLSQLKEIVDIVFAPCLAESHVCYLDTLLKEHYGLLLELFPDFKLKPKFHFVLHYPDMILAYGPLIHFWCMRFEAKHNYFKTLVHVVRNFKNLTLTLAGRHQMMQTCHMLSGKDDFLKPNLEVSCVVEIHPASLSLEVCNLLKTAGFTNQEYHHTTNSITLNGIQYRTKMVVVIGYDQDEPCFGQIDMIFVEGSSVWFLVRKFQSHGVAEVQACEITGQCDQLLVSVTDIKDYYPLSIYSVLEKKYVVPKHLLFDINQHVKC